MRFPRRGTLIAGTAGRDEKFGEGFHWLLDGHHLTMTDRITYPLPPSGAPTAPGRRHPGDGTRATAPGRRHLGTLSEDRTTVSIWP